MYLLLLLLGWWIIGIGCRIQGEIGRIVAFFLGGVSFVWGLVISPWQIQLLILLPLCQSNNDKNYSTLIRQA